MWSSCVRHCYGLKADNIVLRGHLLCSTCGTLKVSAFQIQTFNSLFEFLPTLLQISLKELLYLFAASF